jgi:predicted permease
MKALRRVLQRFRNSLHLRRSESDLAEELQLHIDLQTQDNIRSGMTADEACRAARLKFGAVEAIKETYRSQHRLRLLEDFFSDLFYAFRQLRQSRGFTVTVVITLALCIGANAALFGVLHPLLLRGLPFRNADRLVYVSEIWPHEAAILFPASPDFNKWKQRGKTFEKLEAWGGNGVLTMTGVGDPERIQGTTVSSGLLDLLGVQPMLGRNFFPEEDRSGGPDAVILGNRFWQHRFASDTKIIGQSIVLNGRARTVVGVLPPSFVFPDNGYSDDILTPMRLSTDPDWHENTFSFLRAIALLKPGVTPEALRTEFAAIVQSGASQEPPQFVTMRKDMSVVVTPLRQWMTGDVSSFLLILQAAAMLVLLTGCLNVANIQIARSLARQKELALRASLGAGRSRLIRQLLTESLLLSLVGGSAGLLTGFLALRYLRFLLPQNIHLIETVRLDAVVFFFALVLSVGTGLLTGLIPAIAASRHNLRGRIAEGHQTLRGALVVAQVALAMVLVVASGLLVQSFWRLASVDLGFEPRGVVTLRVPLVGRNYATPEARKGFAMNLLEKSRALPGVREAAIGGGLPIAGSLAAGIVAEDQPPPPPGGAPTLPVVGASAAYFRALGIPVLRGRVFTEADREDAPLVAAVNQAFADRFYPAGNAIGKHVKFGSVAATPWIEIVGIVGNVHHRGLLLDNEPVVYTPHTQGASAGGDLLLILKSDVNSATVIADATKLVHTIDPTMPVFDVATMDDRVSTALTDQRASMVAMGISGLLSLLLAATGIFGVIAYLVNRREREFGIRVALGAQSRDMLLLVLRNGLFLAGVGIVAGLIASLFVTKVLAKLLYETAPNDPITLVASATIFLFVAMLACYIPARRASHVNPTEMLRNG